MSVNDDTHSAICIENLSYTYPLQDQPVLKDINLEITQGEFVVIMGPTGEGKSTLSLCLNGVVPRIMGGELRGSVEILGFSPAEKDIYEMATKIGLVFQDADSQICNIFVREEVAFGAQNLLVPKETILQRIKRVLRFVRLSEFEDSPVFNLSGGQKQRVAIASVLAMEPGVVVFDEPTANLDPLGAKEVLELIRELKKENVTILVIEHDVSSFIDLADRIVILHSGSIAYQGPPRAVFQEHGREIISSCGLRLPEVVDFALQAEKKGYAFDPFPLTVEEVPSDMLRFRKQELPTPPERPTKPAGETAIEVSDLTFKYGSGPLILKGVTFRIPKGEILAIAGPNGSGKSTLTSQFIGINRPTSGSVRVAGLDVSKATIKDLARHVGYVFQYPEHQFVTDTVFDEIAFGLKWQGLSPEEVNRRTEQMLADFQLAHVKDRHPFSLSRGQKRRLSVASMLVMKPEIFILDEPTTGQDQRNLSQLMGFIQELNRQGLTIVLVTHDMGLVAEYADQVLVLENGQIAFHGSPWKLFTEEMALEEKYSLTLPATIRLYLKAREQASWLPPVTSPAGLASLLEERH